MANTRAHRFPDGGCPPARRRAGFTLLEMLIVVAILAILIAIAIPLFTSLLENARQATDLANMRSAYALAEIEWATGKHDGEQTYYFNGGTIQTDPANIRGYGQSTHDASTFSEDLPIPAAGVPHGEDGARFISITIAEDGSASLLWTNGYGGYFGHNITSASQYKSLSREEKLALDTLLLDSMQDAARKMTYGDLKALMSKYNIRPETGWGHSCYKIALSCIDDASGEIVQSKNDPTVRELFTAAGYQISDDPSKQYIFTSSGLNNVTAPNYEVSIWIDVGANIRNVSDDDLASNAVVYINDNGRGKHQFNHPARVEYSNNRP